MSWDLEFEHRVGVLGWTAPHYLPGCREQRSKMGAYAEMIALLHLSSMLICCNPLFGTVLEEAGGWCRLCVFWLRSEQGICADGLCRLRSI